MAHAVPHCIMMSSTVSMYRNGVPYLIFLTLTYRTPLGFKQHYLFMFVVVMLGSGVLPTWVHSLSLHHPILSDHLRQLFFNLLHWQALIHLNTRPCVTGHRNAVRLHPVNHFDLFSEPGTMAHAVPLCITIWPLPPV